MVSQKARAGIQIVSRGCFSSVRKAKTIINNNKNQDYKQLSVAKLITVGENCLNKHKFALLDSNQTIIFFSLAPVFGSVMQR